jgi:hypothetical protein
MNGRGDGVWGEKQNLLLLSQLFFIYFPFMKINSISALAHKNLFPPPHATHCSRKNNENGD